MEERTFTMQEVEAMVTEAVANYEKEQNIAALKEELSAKLEETSASKTELDDAKAALETERADFESVKTEFEESKAGYISPEEYDEKVKAAVNDAIALNERYHERVEKFKQAGIELDETGLGKLRTEDDDFVNWLFETVAKKANTEASEEPPVENEPGAEPPAEEPKEPANAATATKNLNATPPVGVTPAKAGVKQDHLADIREGFTKKLKSL